jgi:hypothetical protein
MMGQIAAFPAQPPMPAVARILSRFDRDQLAGFIAVAIDLADAMDGDPDNEDADPPEGNDDEQDGSSGAEDEFITHLWAQGAGCPVADPGGCEHDGREPDLY